MPQSNTTPGQVALIGGSGLNRYPELAVESVQTVDTPFGESAPLTRGTLAGKPLVFMPRHGPEHSVPPHQINYRANLWALHYSGVTHILAVNAVGGIRDDLHPGRLVLPDQIIDYTFGREHTFFDGGDRGIHHIDFTQPYDPAWRALVARAGEEGGFNLAGDGVYGCTQGPRLETAAEVRRLARDGCDLAGMTAMPEAALARELELAYAGLGVVVNWAAGISREPITLEAIHRELQGSVAQVKGLLAVLLTLFMDEL